MFIFLLGLAGGLIFCILFVGYLSVPETSTLFFFFVLPLWIVSLLSVLCLDQASEFTRLI